MTFSLSFILWAIPAFLLYFTFWSVPCREGQNLPSVHFQGGFVLLHSLLLHHSGVMLIVFHSGCCPQLQKEPFGGDTCPCLAAAFPEVSGIPSVCFSDPPAQPSRVGLHHFGQGVEQEMKCMGPRSQKNMAMFVEESDQTASKCLSYFLTLEIPGTRSLILLISVGNLM